MIVLVGTLLLACGTPRPPTPPAPQTCGPGAQVEVHAGGRLLHRGLCPLNTVVEVDTTPNDRAELDIRLSDPPGRLGCTVANDFAAMLREELDQTHGFIPIREGGSVQVRLQLDAGQLQAGHDDGAPLSCVWTPNAP